MYYLVLILRLYSTYRQKDCVYLNPKVADSTSQIQETDGSTTVIYIVWDSLFRLDYSMRFQDSFETQIYSIDSLTISRDRR